ncbi:MAG: capsule biosynthesis protein [Gloeocapsa sp. DLM2.Bin57]|nr:MAG: capsule biosynthesis protein [Gloeocapsa sp. DLM2.Bin57]
MLKKVLKQQPFLARQVRLAKRKKRSIVDRPHWEEFVNSEAIAWHNILTQAKTGELILIPTSIGGDIHLISIESLLAVALTLRGAQVHFLLCDGILPACFWCDATFYPKQEYFAKTGPQQDLCNLCYPFAQEVLQPLGLTIHRYSDFLTEPDYQEAAKLANSLSRKEIPQYTWSEIKVGEHALAGALRFYASASLESESQGEEILRRYFQAALLTTLATQKLLTTHNYHCAVFNHGIYVPQGLTGEVARQQGVRIVNWNPAYRKQCFIFTHHDTYHHQLMWENVTNWENIPWNKQLEQQLLDYLKSRWVGSNDWIWFHENPQFDLKAIASEIGVDFTLPCIGLLTNVMWDAQLHYPANAFKSLLDWVLTTIEYFRQRRDLQLLIRVHPAEIRGTLPSRQPIIAEIAKAIPNLPPNVFIIPPESQVSTYAAMLACRAVLIYGTKMGVELTSMGIPVIVAGEAWIRNKQITRDATSIEEYISYLDQLPLSEGLSDDTLIRARKYAYHFFFRRMIPLELTTQAQNPSEFKLKPDLKIADLLPGNSRGLDLICDGILQGSEFIYPAELD